MKRGSPDHPKTKRLAQILGLARWEVVGLLESLWHFTSNYAKRGDIGKWSDAEIASHLEWSRCPAEELINALVEVRLVDRCSQNRLLVHDWEDHCDQTVTRSEEVKKLGFAKCITASSSDKLASASQPCQSPAKALPSQSPAKALPRAHARATEAESRSVPQQAAGSGKQEAGIFKCLTSDILRDTGQLVAWYQRATSQRKPVIHHSDANRMRVVTAAERAIEVGEDPVALFAWIVSKGEWAKASQEQEERARRRLAEFDREERGAMPIGSLLKSGP